MRTRTDGLVECAFSELTDAQRREAMASLPTSPPSRATCPFCQGVSKPGLVGGMAVCRVCKARSWPPAWQGVAGSLYWRVAQDGRVAGYDREIRF